MIKRISLLGAICLAGLFTFAVHAGVIVEGGSTGMDKVVTLAYQPGQNSYTINGSTVLRCPVSAGEMVEIVRALRLDDRMGVAAKGDDQLQVYGELATQGTVVRKLQEADDFLRAVVFADGARLRGVTLPEGYVPQAAAKRQRDSALYFNLDGVQYHRSGENYVPETSRAELVLIPMSSQAAADGSPQPDYDALERGDYQQEDFANAEHIRRHQQEYLRLPALSGAVKIGQAAAFVRHLRASGVDLAALEQRLSEGEPFTMAATLGQGGQGLSAAPAAPAPAAEAVLSPAAELEQQKLFSENIKKVLMLDNQYGRDHAVKMTRATVNDGSYVEFRKRYLDNIRSVDLSASPAEFKEAYAAHAAAWEKTIAWLAGQNIADTPEAFDAFKAAHAPYRAELGATFKRCKEVAAAYLK